MSDELTVDLGERLGAQERSSAQSFVIYLPDRDKDGNPIANHRDWIEEALALLSEINGGATATAPVEGAWENDEGVLIREKTVLVYSFVKAEAFIENLDRIRDLLHRFGRETGQGEVAFEFDHEFFLIRNYDGDE